MATPLGRRGADPPPHAVCLLRGAYVNSGYPILYFASEGQLFSHVQARRPLILEAVYRMAGLLASVPVWQLVGLM